MLTLIQGIGIVAISIAGAISGQFLLHRHLPLHVRKQQNDVAGFIYAVVGVAYAALLAFMFIIVWQEFDNTRTTVEHEANEVAAIYQIAGQIGRSQGQQVQDLSRSYAEIVVNQEWPLMANGRESQQAWDTLAQLGKTIEQIQPQDAREQALYGQLLDRLHDLSDNRRVRLLDAREAVGWGFWILMIFLGIITIGFTYLFGLENTVGHAVMIAAITATIVSILFLINAIDLPFRGDIRVGPDAFRLMLEQLDK